MAGHSNINWRERKDWYNTKLVFFVGVLVCGVESKQTEQSNKEPQSSHTKIRADLHAVNEK